ncbi:MAG: nuclear transport factor 2 family protein [Rhizomicrobium sp.]|nr:nuclear transport factor 2 family protein [Rhizomicrobium sp.]
MKLRLFIMLTAGFVFSAAAWAQNIELQSTVASYLNSYAIGDRAAVLGALDPDVRSYGSDVAEVFSGKDAVAKMFDEDMKLWGATAKFGEMHNVSIVSEGALETIFFDVPFSVAGRPPVQVRVAMVWRSGAQGWKLVQSSNTVPTVGQSAADILKSLSKQ